MGDQTEIQEYNYSNFVSSDFLAFRTHLPVGSAAPDCCPSLLETGQRVRLRDYWKNNDVVVEFGSLT